MSVIRIEEMEFFSHHGCFDEEKKIGTWFKVDLSFDVDTSAAETSDDLADTVNYQSVYSVVKDEMEKSSNLLEHVACRILDTVMRNFPTISGANIKIRKMNPPLGGKIGSVSVELSTK